MATCYLCGQPVDSSRSTSDHVIPRTLLGDRRSKVRGFDYGGRQQTHPECNNGFGDETHVRKPLQLLGALHDSEATLSRCSPGNLVCPRLVVQPSLPTSLRHRPPLELL